MVRLINILSKILNRIPDSYKYVLYGFVLNYAPLSLIKKVPCSYSTYLKCYSPKKGDIVLDCGAHNGNCTILFSRCVGKDGLVIALEPFAESFKILKNRIKQYGRRRIVAINKGVWNENGEMSLEVFSNTIGCKTVQNNASVTANDNCVIIDCITIDVLVKQMNLDRLDLIKMDIEGAEIEALEGSINTLEQYTPHVAIASYHIRKNQKTCHQIEKILQQCGYLTDTIFPPHLTTHGKKIPEANLVD